MKELTFQEIDIGREESFQVELTPEKVRKFSEITGDFNLLHTDREYAESKGFEDKVSYGMLTASFFSTLAGMYLPGKYSIIHNVDVSFTKPVYVKEKTILTVIGKVTEKHDMFKQLTLKVQILSEENVKVCRGFMKVGVMDE